MNNEVDTNKHVTELGGLEKYGMLLMGIFLVILSGGRFVTPSAAFLAPVFLLRYTRNSMTRSGIGILYVLLYMSLLVRLHDYFDVPRPLSLLFIAGLAVLEALPFFVDRKLFNKLPVFLSPFVLPSMFVVVGFIASLVLPFGSMGDKAYSQVGNYELMQLLSITGTHGITFLIFWFAATMASLWDAGFIWQRCKSQVAPLALCLMLAFVAGGFRNIFDENESPTVRIAGVVGDQAALVQALHDAGVEGGFNGLSSSGYAADEADSALGHYHDDLFSRTELQAKNGAAIVTWAEASAVVFESQEQEFAARAARLARDQSIYLVVPFAVIVDPNTSTQVESQQAENKLTVFSPQGETLGHYRRTKMLWNELYVAGDGQPLLLDTEYGRIGFVIGFDTDFASMIRQLSEADIIIAPSSDWRTLAPHHSLMATFRGVENGFSVFRPTNTGVSLASDSHGRILARTDHFRTSPHALVANVPTGGVKTFYGSAGEWFAWFNAALLSALIVIALIAKKRRNGRANQSVNSVRPEEVRDRSRITAIQWRDSERDNNLHKDG